MARQSATQPDAARHLLRHSVATLAYRGAKALRDVPEGFAEFQVGPSSRTPARILSHVGDLLDWALVLAKGDYKWKDSNPLPWREEVTRFFSALDALDDYLASDQPLGESAEKIFQGPIADSLTHVGQLTMVRRLAGAPVRAENYFRADISAGRVGPDQRAPVREFD